MKSHPNKTLIMATSSICYITEIFHEITFHWQVQSSIQDKNIIFITLKKHIVTIFTLPNGKKDYLMAWQAIWRCKLIDDIASYMMT